MLPGINYPNKLKTQPSRRAQGKDQDGASKRRSALSAGPTGSTRKDAGLGTEAWGSHAGSTKGRGGRRGLSHNDPHFSMGAMQGEAE